jgi:rhodanese-related sulfurtransferase
MIRLAFPALLLLSACTPPPPAEVRTEPPAINLPDSVQQLTADQAAALIQSTPDLVILDLREDWEIKKEGRIAGSVWADYLNAQRFTEATAKLDPAKPCLLYCAIGGRSKLAAEKLAAKGFTRLSLLTGGWEEWLRAGKPVQK